MSCANSVVTLMEIGNFGQAVRYLESLIPKYKTRRPTIKLDRIRALAKEAGNPQDSYHIIHVGGTAGKGSTATFAASMLQESGYDIGLHISPHLQDIRERAQVNGRLMGKEDFVRLAKEMKEYVELVGDKYGYGIPTYFEALVMLAFRHFEENEVDAAVIEVGLGGALDGTNIVMPKVAVLTNVGLDHTEILGDTVEKIAHDKVGIFKGGVDIVSGVTQPSVIKMAKAKAVQEGCRSFSLLGDSIRPSIRSSGTGGSVFDLSLDGELEYDGLRISAVGEYQVANASLALAAVMKIGRCGLEVDEDSFRLALKTTTIPGRFEVVASKPVVILDGAHNPMKAAALEGALEECYPNKRIRFVFAVKKGKDSKQMLGILSKNAEKFYFTRFEATTDFGKNMSHDPYELASQTTAASEVLENPQDAFNKAVADAGDIGVVCVAGSLYLDGEIRSMLKRGAGSQSARVAL